jgi:cytidylate kinase
MTLSIGLFFTLMVLGLASALPSSLYHGLLQQGVPQADASRISHLPPVGSLFAAFLGYNPMASLLGPVLGHLPASRAAVLTGRSFFPDLISRPFMTGMRVTFYFSAAMMLVAAAASWMRGKRYVHDEQRLEVAAAGGHPPLRSYDRSGPVRTITISASYGAGGDEVSRRVAELLSLPFLDRAIPVEVAEELAAPLDQVLSEEASGHNGVGDVLAGLARGVGPVAPSPAADAEGEGDAERFRRQTEAVIRRLASQGGVILGRGAAIILADRDDVLRVRLDGPAELRVQRVAELTGIDLATARRDQRHTDRARQVYLRHFYDADPADPGLYDVWIDTTAVGPDAAARMIVEAVRGRVPSGVSS